MRLRQGDPDHPTEFGDDPLAMALHWQELGAMRLHLVDLDGAFSGSSAHLEIAGSIFRTLKIPVQFGGGLRTLEQIERILSLGAARAVLGSVAVEHPQTVEEAVRRWPGAIVAGIDARNGRVALHGWVDQTAMSALELAARMKSLGVERVIYTDVLRDGLLGGVDVEETARIGHETGIRVIASGGVSCAEDVRRLWERRADGIEGVILGRALYEKKIDFVELRSKVINW